MKHLVVENNLHYALYVQAVAQRKTLKELTHEILSKYCNPTVPKGKK